MHPNPAFRKAQTQQNIAFARERSFGVLSMNGADGPLVSHVPFQLSEDGARLELHLVRSNPIVKALRDGPVPAVVAVQGPDAYVSPDWYGVADQVPTWNYVAVHLRGHLRLLEPEALRGVLDRLSDAMEARLLPKPIWKMWKMDDGALERMLRQIIPLEMAVARVDGTWKLGQNKPDDVRQRAGEALERSFGSSVAQLAAWMRDPPA